MTILNTLLEITIYSAILSGAIWMFRLLLKKHLSPMMLYMAWFLVIARLLIPVTVNSGFSLIVVPAEKPSTQAGSVNVAEPLEGLDNTVVLDRSETVVDDESTVSNNETSALHTQTDNLQETSKVSASHVPLEFEWKTVLIAIWLAGAAAMLIQIGASTIRLSKRLAGALSIPPEWQRIADKLKREIGLRNNVRIVMVKGFPSPALSAGLRPIVVLPEELIGKSDGDVRFALLHELTHIKRGDHIVSLLLLLLRAVYWFNPVVWLMAKQMRLDMETACDSRLTRPLSTRDRKRYAGTMLSMYADKQVRYVLGMAMGQTKKTAEQRLRGMFMRRRSSRRGKAMAALLAVVLLVTCFTTACQPTPEKPFVQSKDNDAVAEAIASSPPDSPAEIHRYAAPETWQSEIYDDAKKIGINVDAQVAVPTDTWGIYQLSAMAPDPAYLDNVLNALIGDAEIFGEDTYLSRDELQRKLARIDEEIAMVQQQDTNPAQEDAELADDGPEVVPEYDKEGALADLREQRAQIFAALQNAPEESTTTRVEINTDVLFGVTDDVTQTENNYAIDGAPSTCVYQDGGFVEIHGLVDTGKIEPARIYLSKGMTGTIDISFIDAVTGGNGGFSGREPIGEQPMEGITISENEAAHIARQAAKDMGFDYLDIAAVHKMSVYNSNAGEHTDCYAFTFTRSLDGIPATYAYWEGGMTEGELLKYEQQYTKQWQVSEMLIGVDDSGIIRVKINTPKSDVTQLADGIELKDFEEIMEIFNQQSIVEGCFSPFDFGALSREFDIDEIRLGYMPTIWKDHPDEIIFVPVWDFFGSETTTFDENFEDKEISDLYASLDENYQRTFDMCNRSILTINAIDGTIMRRLNHS